MKYSRYMASTATGAVALFLILLAALHFLEPEFDPSRRLISEYELGRYGWIMSLAFFSLGVAAAAMLLSTWHSPTTRGGLIGRWWFAAIGAAFFGAGIFYPSPASSIASLIHGICGIIVIATFPIAATLYGSGLAQAREGAASRRRLRWATIFVWVGFLSFAGSIVVLGITSPPVSRSAASLAIGWQNRFMIVTYGLWLVAAAGRALPSNPGRK